LLSLIAVSTTVAGIIEGPERGWTGPVTTTLISAGVAAGIGFVIRELRADHPLLDVRLFRSALFGAGSLAITAQFFASFGFFFATLQYLQFVVGYSPLRAAAALLPLPVVMIPLARHAPRIAARIGFVRITPIGLVLSALGLAVISQVGVEFSAPRFTAGLVVFGAGMALAGTPSTTAITAALPAARQGVASAVNDTARELGSAFGIAILGSALNQTYRDTLAPALTGLPDQVQQVALRSVAFTSSDRIALAGQAGAHLVERAQSAFVDGIASALLTASVVCLLAAVVVAVLARRAGHAA
jgi:hypothetical protein